MKILTAIVLTLIVGCAPPENKAKTATGDILVGEFGSMTGPEATFGVSTHNGILMAADEINAAGGVRGRKIRIISEDDQSKPEEAAVAVQKLISSDQVISVLGEVASSSSLAAAPICEGSSIPMISPSSTHPAVTQVGEFIFRMCFIDTYQGPVMATYLRQELGIETIALLTDNRSDYSRGLGDAFAKTFLELGGRIVARQSFSKGDSDFRPQLTAIKETRPQAVFVPGYYNDVGQIAIQARDLGITVPLVGGDGWESPKLLELGGKALEGCLYSNHYFVDDPAPAVQTFVRSYERRHGAKPDSLAALGYDSMRVLADAMRRANSFEPTAIREQLAKTSDFAGVTGRITLGPDRNPVGKKLVVLEVKNGALTLKKTLDPQKQ